MTFLRTHYLGSLPTIVTIDPDLISYIMVKNFDCFVDTNGLNMPENKMTLGRLTTPGHSGQFSVEMCKIFHVFLHLKT